MVKLKKKVTLKKKVAPTSGRKKSLLWLLCAFCVVVVIVILLFLKKDSPEPEVLTEEVVVMTSDSASESTMTQDIIMKDDYVVEKEDSLNVNNTTVQDQTASAISYFTMDDEYAEQMAWSVIRGNYGNNPVRRQKLGDEYQIIQDKVNEFYRKGLVH